MTETMKKIADLSVGGSAKLPLLLKDFSIKQTKTLKDYLWAVFTDGVVDIQAQDWDWQTNPSLMSGQKLEKGLVYNVAGQCSEYQGNKQLKLVRMDLSDLDPMAFAPQGGVDVGLYEQKVEDLLNRAENINFKLGNLARDVIHDNYKVFTTVPAANGIHHAYVHGLLKHSVDVTEKAVAMAELVPGVDMALVITGALLHDIGKVRTYRLNGAIIEMTEEGQMIEHIMIGAMMLDKYRNDYNDSLVGLLLHIISSHHGKREYGSPTTPRFLEAMIVNMADGLDAATETVYSQVGSVEGDWSGKIWTQGNLPFLTPGAVSNRLDQ